MLPYRRGEHDATKRWGHIWQFTASFCFFYHSTISCHVVEVLFSGGFTSSFYLMDAAFHGGVSSHEWGVSGGRRVYKTRAHAIAYGSPYQKAAVLVHFAENRNGLPEEILELPRMEAAAKFFFIFIRFDIIWTLNCFALIALNFFEKPLWCTSVSKISCSNSEYYYFGGLPYLTNAESLAYKGVTLAILVVHTLFPILYIGGQLYWRSCAKILKVIGLLFLTADLVVDILNLSTGAIFSFPLRIAPFFRVVFFILNIRDLRDSLIILVAMLRTYLNVLVMSLLYLLFSSWLAQVIFEDTEQGTTYFVSYPATLYQMFVLFTTSNNPDVWIPAYKSSRWSSIFFLLYVLIGVYFLTNLILAVVYDSFKSELGKQVGKKDRMRTRILGRAFNLIDENGVGTLDKDQCFLLFEELNKYGTLPKIPKEDFECIFDALDDSNDSKVDAPEFNNLCKAIAMKFEKMDLEPWLKKYPFYNSSLSETLKDFVKSAKFGYLFIFLLLLNLAAIITERTLDKQNKSGHKSMQKVELVFAWIFVVEMALIVYACGFKAYWLHGQTRFYFIIIWITVIGETITFISPKELKFTSNAVWLRFLLIARMLRMTRLMIQIFGGKVNAGNPDLPSTDLADNDYLLFNFNDYPNGMVTLFNMLVTGNWQVWMKSYATLTGTAWTYLYFISFYLIPVLLLLNLIAAFVLEAFFAELEVKAREQEKGLRDSEQGRRRTVGTKIRRHRVDLLLHHMLSMEPALTIHKNTSTSISPI